ncbi:MAG: IPT/TIG domain-containing protein [Solirubrobacteraceae bacterium]
MNRSLKIVLTAATVLAAPIAQASAAPTKAVYPSVSSISPKRVAIGSTMTVKGKGFRAGKNRNTVVFQRVGKPAVFVRAVSATTTKLSVKIPTKLTDFLATKAGAPTPTTFRLRILSARFARAFTPASLSPVITPKAASTGAGGSGTAPGSGTAAPAAPTCQQVAAADPSGDKDGDGISNGREAQILTDACNPDSDGDGMVDGYEYQSALDLNSIALPYPGSRPWPNPLDPSDGKYDFDGDGLSLSQEFALWRYAGSGFPVTQYSDGTQNSGGRVYVSSPTQALQDEDGTGVLTDDERDADGDNLSNMVEFNLRGTQQWWKLTYAGEAPYSISTFSAPSAINPDSDGDGVNDGADDQDHDGFTNFQEMTETREGTDIRVQPYNPCLPNPWSRTCSRYTPFSGVWAPFDGSQQAGDMIPFHVTFTPGTTPDNTWNGLGGPQN